MSGPVQQTLGERLDSARSLAQSSLGMTVVMAAFIGALADDLLTAPIAEIKRVRKARRALPPVTGGRSLEELAVLEDANEDAEFVDLVGVRPMFPGDDVGEVS